MYGIIRRLRYLQSPRTKWLFCNQYYIWKYEGWGTSTKKSLPTCLPDSISIGCGFYIIHNSQTTQKLQLCAIDSILGVNSNFDNNMGNKVTELNLLEIVNVKDIACGRSHALILAVDGTVYSYGLNSLGQCGQPMTDTSHNNLSIQTINTDFRTSQIACGLDHCLFLSSEGKVFACGWSADGQTGSKESIPVVCQPSQVHGNINNHVVTKVYAGGDSCLAVTDQQQVFAWGNNEYGQLGVDSQEQQVRTPTQVNLDTLDTPLVSTGIGGSFTTFLTESGQIHYCGYGLSFIQENPSQLFHLFTLPNSTVTWQSLQCGLHYCIALTKGELFLWGHYPPIVTTYHPHKILLPKQVTLVKAGPNAIYGIGT